MLLVLGALFGAEAFAHERENDTWESLLLTGVSTRQILLGKWAVVLGRLRLWTLILLGSWYAGADLLFFRFNSFGGRFSVARFLIGNAAIPFLAVLEILCSSAIGMAASAVVRRGTWSALAGLAVRVSPMIVFGQNLSSVCL